MITAPSALIETLRERMFKPSLSTIITENTKYYICFSYYFLSIVRNKKNVDLAMLSTSRVAIVSPTDPVCVAAQNMREFRVNSVVVATGNTLQGIFT